MSILLAWNNYVVGGLTVLFLLVCVMMILTVLIQRPQGGGLSGAFGSGAGSGQTAFGAKTGDALTIFTIIVFVMFIAFGIILNYGYRPEGAIKGPASTVTPASEKSGGTKTSPEKAEPAKSEGAAPAPGEQAPGATPPAGAPAEPSKAPDQAAPIPAPAPTTPPSNPTPPPADPK